MKIGLIGLGKMGFNLGLNMREHGNEIAAYDVSKEAVEAAREYGLESCLEIDEFLLKLPAQKVIWLMIPAGKIVDDTVEEITPRLAAGDIVIDGGNSYYKDTLRRYETLKKLGIAFVDVGTSGGVEGARHGVCAMVGADEGVFAQIEPLIRDISVNGGYIRTGKPGSGHYVKMVHNGIEYGMMQAMGEGFEIMDESGFDLQLERIAGVWNHGSVIRSWMMELAESMLIKSPSLNGIKGVVRSSGEGLWTVQEALDLKVAAPVITESLFARYRSEREDTFAGKFAAGLRGEFGGHAVERNDT